MSSTERLQNAHPLVVAPAPELRKAVRTNILDNLDGVPDAIDAAEIFDLIRHINDPEHPLTLEQLNVARSDLIAVDAENTSVVVRFTPTIPHCSMATLIGLCIRVQLIRSLPSKFKVDVIVTEGTHQSEHAVNKQLNDKERVAAALENKHLLEVVNQCLKRAIETQLQQQQAENII